MGSLYGVNSIRNASAHSNPLLFDLPKKELESVNKDLKDYAKSREIVEVFYKCQKVHDVLSVFLVHEKFVKGSGSRKYRINDFKALTTKALGKFSYLNPGNDILYFFKIMEKAIDKYDI